MVDSYSNPPSKAAAQTAAYGKMNSMTWGYVAGFFDGEGCASLQHSPRRSKPFYRFSLHNNHKTTIDALYQFLTENGIRCSILERKRKNPKHATAYAISIKDAASTVVGSFGLKVTKADR